MTDTRTPQQIATSRGMIALWKRRKAGNKYGALKVAIGALKFDSKREAKRWQELKLLENAGKITGLARQIVYELAPAVKLHGEARKKPALRYVADFRYITLPDFAYVVEDAKGHETDVSRIKRHLMKSVHGIDVRIT